MMCFFSNLPSGHGNIHETLYENCMNVQLRMFIECSELIWILNFVRTLEVVCAVEALGEHSSVCMKYEISEFIFI